MWASYLKAFIKTCYTFHKECFKSIFMSFLEVACRLVSQSFTDVLHIRPLLLLIDV